MAISEIIDAFIAHWRETGGDELANSQSFINGLCDIIGVERPHGSKADIALNDHVFERRVFQDNGDGTTSFGRIDAHKCGAFILEAKQGSEADRAGSAWVLRPPMVAPASTGQWQHQAAAAISSPCPGS